MFGLVQIEQHAGAALRGGQPARPELHHRGMVHPIPPQAARGERPVQPQAGHQRQRDNKHQRLHGGKAFDAVRLPRGGVDRVPIGEQQ